jgi:molybdenum cofactor cytidylyltransferase
MRTAGLLLAAGGSRRLGTPKQLLPGDDDRPLVTRAAQQLLAVGCTPVIVVLGAEAADVGAAVGALPVQCVMNADWARGMGGSIAAGIAALEAGAGDGAAPDAVLIAACDMPSVTEAHLMALLTAATDGRRVASAYPRDDGTLVRGVPAVLPHPDWPWLRTLTEDQGARDLLRHADTKAVLLPDGALDLDTVADLARWRASGAAWQLSPRVSLSDLRTS